VGDARAAARDLPDGFTVEKIHVRTAYARNGNAHNPTRYYEWRLHGPQGVHGQFRLRRLAVEASHDDHAASAAGGSTP
jgi:hypothetical protein